MKSKTFGKILVLAFLMSYIPYKFRWQAILNIYAWGLIIGLGVYFYLRSKEKKVEGSQKSEKK